MALLDRTTAPVPPDLSTGAEAADGGQPADRAGRRAAWIGWSICAVYWVCIGFGKWLEYQQNELSRLAIVEGAALTIAFGLFAVVGAVLVSRRPKNIIGWLYCAIGLGSGITYLAPTYVDYALLHPGASVPGVAYVLVVESFIWTSMFGLYGVFALLLYPTGRPPSRRWNFLGWMAGLGILLMVVTTLVAPGHIIGITEQIENPLGIAAFGSVPRILNDLATGLILLPIPASVVSLIVRFRRARGIERLQLKWLTLSAAVGVVIVFVSVILNWPLGDIPFALALAQLPISMGIAILRYRLYEIDRLINRALVYGFLSAALGGLYLALVFGLQSLLDPLTSGSDLAVAGSTLAVAALFQPLRSRTQRVVNRRFYRNRYDADRTVAAFSARLRDEVELDTLRADLQAVVRETMQPEHVSLWLRPPAS